MIDLQELYQIQQLAERFRHAIEDAQEAREFVNHPPLRYFPRGCCEVASDLLAEYLRENGIDTYGVFGEWRDDENYDVDPHEWLVLNDDTSVIIDITCDQFKCNPRFYRFSQYCIPAHVGPINELYKMFEIVDPHRNTGINYGTEYSKQSLNCFYEIIREYLKE